MSKFIAIPAPAEVRDPITDAPTGESVPFATTVRIVCAIAAQAGADALTLIDVRRKLAEGKPGEVVELSDGEHEAVKAHFRSPRGMTPALMFSAEAHLRAVVDAPSAKP